MIVIEQVPDAQSHESLNSWSESYVNNGSRNITEQYFKLTKYPVCTTHKSKDKHKNLPAHARSDNSLITEVPFPNKVSPESKLLLRLRLFDNAMVITI